MPILGLYVNLHIPVLLTRHTLKVGVILKSKLLDQLISQQDS